MANAAWNGWNCTQAPALLRQSLPPLPMQHLAVVSEPASPEVSVPVADEPGAGNEALPVRMPAQTREHKAEPAPGTETIAEPDWQLLAYRPAVDIPLEDLPARFYVVQIVAMSAPEGLEEFRCEHHLQGVPAARIESGGSIYHALLLGVYETRAAALAAAASRPASLQHLEPWVRTLGSLQVALERADERIRVSGR